MQENKFKTLINGIMISYEKKKHIMGNMDKLLEMIMGQIFVK